MLFTSMNKEWSGAWVKEMLANGIWVVGVDIGDGDDWCRWDISLISNLPIGTTFGLWSIHSHCRPRMQPLECFFVQISRNPFSKSGQNCDEVIPLNRANSGDLNGVIPTFIPILEGEIWKLPGFCLPALPGWCR